MPETLRADLLRTLQDDWGAYVEQFQRLAPHAQAAFLRQQGYARFADLLAHLIAWWKEGRLGVKAALEDPGYTGKVYDVDAFNAQSVDRFRGWSEETVTAAFEDLRIAMTELVAGLPEQAMMNPRVTDRLKMEIIGHLTQHEIDPGSS